MKEKFLIGSNYFARPDSVQAPWFFKLWMRGVMPRRTLLLVSGENPPPYTDGDIETAHLMKIHLQGNLGAFMELINKQKPHRFCGWTGAILQLALSAYCDESDFIYVEQDVLMFGDCIGQMYREIGDGGVIFGSTSGQPCAQSLFLVKHSYIPDFVRLILGEGPQSEPDQLGEQIFARLEQQNPEKWKRFSFGYDRPRPLDIHDDCWYAQKFSPEELLQLRAAGMVKFDSLPEGVEVFSSTKI